MNAEAVDAAPCVPVRRTRRLPLRRSIACAAALAMLIVLTACSSTPEKGVVTGWIDACAAIIFQPAHPHAAGTVTVFRGRITMRPIGSGTYENVFPSPAVAQQSVGDGQQFTFALSPGHYVLRGEYPSGGYPQPAIEVTVSAGQTTNRDIPNECI